VFLNVASEPLDSSHRPMTAQARENVRLYLRYGTNANSLTLNFGLIYEQ